MSGLRSGTREGLQAPPPPGIPIADSGGLGTGEHGLQVVVTTNEYGKVFIMASVRDPKRVRRVLKAGLAAVERNAW